MGFILSLLGCPGHRAAPSLLPLQHPVKENWKPKYDSGKQTPTLKPLSEVRHALYQPTWDPDIHTASILSDSPERRLLATAWKRKRDAPRGPVSTPGSLLPRHEPFAVITEAQWVAHLLDGIPIMVFLAQELLHFLLVPCCDVLE
jgi:hypothetical protein